MQGYPTIVRTGSPDLDVQAVEQHRRAAAANGVTLHVEPLAGGGFQLTVTDGGARAVGSTLPSNHVPSLAPRASHQPPAPLPPQVGGGDPGGTLPSNFANYAYAAGIHGPPKVEVILRPGEGYCEACHRVGPLRQVTLRQNIGAVVLRFPRVVSGQLCKFCIDKFFFRFTGVTLVLGWWGVVSFFHSLYVVPANVVAWLGTSGMVTPTADVDSFREQRARGNLGVVLGLLWGLGAAGLLAVGGLLAWTEPQASVLALAAVGGVFGMVGLVVLGVSLRTRARGTAGLSRLGALR